MTHTSKYFYGNLISDEGIKNGYVDYRTLAQSFDAVLNNDIIKELSAAGFYFESENEEEYKDYSGNYYTSEEADERRDELKEELEALEEERDAMEETRDNLEESDADPAALEEINNKIEVIEGKISEIENDIECLENPDYKDIFQYYIVSDNGADILREANETLFYCEALDLYVWGVDHWGTSWDYVMTNIKLDLPAENN